MYEIEDTMLCRRLPGNERGPGDRTLRRHGGRQAIEAALRPELPQIRQLIPMPFNKTRVHTVHTQDDQFRKALVIIAVTIAHPATHGKSHDQHKRSRVQGYCDGPPR